MFKIESLDLMFNIADRIDDRANELNGVKAEAMSSLENLKTNIQCTGITETLESLSSAINSNTDAVNKLFAESATFIKTNGQSIGTANQNVASGFASSTVNLENIGK